MRLQVRGSSLFLWIHSLAQVACCFILPLASGCGTAGGKHPTLHSPSFPDSTQRIVWESYRDFHGGTIYRPDSLGDSTLEEIWLAPLLVWEGGEEAAGLNAPRFYSPNEDPYASQDWIQTGEPTVYWRHSTHLFRGEAWRTSTYLVAVSFDAGPVRIQGVRMWTAPNGMPVIWEVLSHSSGLQVVYLSEDWEMRSRSPDVNLEADQFKAIDLETWSKKVVVPRLLGEGPQPLGPWVYFRKGSSEVNAVLCRCMESQLLPPTQTHTYRLVKVDTLKKPLQLVLLKHLGEYDPPLDLLPGFNWIPPDS